LFDSNFFPVFANFSQIQKCEKYENVKTVKKITALCPKVMLFPCPQILDLDGSGLWQQIHYFINCIDNYQHKSFILPASVKTILVVFC
jgi:hypothetical protein